MTNDDVADERRSTVPVIAPVRPRKLAKVPFVELADGRLQGVVSSGSDASRVYVSSIAAGGRGLSCSTNNNRPCTGLNGGRACGHVEALADAAVAQYGADRVSRYLGVDPAEGRQGLLAGPAPAPGTNRAAEVFSSFLRHLAHLELPPSADPLPELQWFPAAAVR